MSEATITAFRRWRNAHPLNVWPRWCAASPVTVAAIEDALIERGVDLRCDAAGGLYVGGMLVYEDDSVPDGEFVRLEAPPESPATLPR